MLEEFRSYGNLANALLIPWLIRKNMFIRGYKHQTFSFRLRYLRLVHPFFRDILGNACDMQGSVRCWCFKKSFFSNLVDEIIEMHEEQ